MIFQILLTFDLLTSKKNNKKNLTDMKKIKRALVDTLVF